MQTPFVSIWMLTYNHEAYIAKAIESVMMQKTNFSVMLYIGEDCSTDNTRNICIGLKKKYPDKITLFLNPENNIVKNAKQIYSACFNSGAKYIAMLEGDDYWTDPYKLQKQVDILENNPEIVLCVHNRNINDNIRKNIKKKRKKFPDNNMIVGIEEVLRRDFPMPTQTMMFRNGVINEFPTWFYRTYNGDLALRVLLSEYGHTHYLNEKMATYRIHENGISNNIINFNALFKLVNLYIDINNHFKYLYNNLIQKIIRNDLNKILSKNLSFQDYKKLLKIWLKNSFKYNTINHFKIILYITNSFVSKKINDKH